MPIIPIELSPGFVKNGTPYRRRALVTGGNLVRFHENAYRPIGGWLRRTKLSDGSNIAGLVADSDLEAVRDIIAWRDNSETTQIVFFSNLGVYHLDEAGTITDITPGAYSANNSSKDASTEAGYGLGPYGSGLYSRSFELTGTDVIPPDRWYSGTFGEVLLFGSINNGDVFELDLNTLTTSAVTNAPSNNADLCVTQQRQVFVVGSQGEPRRVQATALENRTDWTPATANQSIDRTLPGNGKLLRCLPVANQVLILGENDAHVGRYVGAPYVYRIEEVGNNCGPICPQAVTKTSSFAVWWGRRNFWLYDGSLQPLECPVSEFLYNDLDPSQESKITAFTNTQYSEVWWLYQGSEVVGSDSIFVLETNSYVCWNYRTNTWYTGRLLRTAGIDAGVLSNVLMVSGNNGYIYEHELEGVLPDTDDRDDAVVFVETGALDLQTGERNLAVRYIYPDEGEGAENMVSYTLYGKQFPNSTEYVYGPYTSANPVPTRAIGRSIRLRAVFSSADSEIGTVRLDVINMGTGQR